MEIMLTGHSISGIEDVMLQKLVRNKAPIQLGFSQSAVHEKYNPNPGVVAFHNGERIGWVPHAVTQKYTLTELGFKSSGIDDVDCIALKIYKQPSGYLGLIVVPKAGYICPYEESDQPQAEQSLMRTPSIQEIVNANVNAAQSAAKLEVGRVANDQLSKIIAARLPKQYGELLQTPVGQLALANAFAVASKATCSENKNIQTIVNMMTLDAYQQLFKLLDVPGIVAELMGNKVIAEALAQTETQEKE